MCMIVYKMATPGREDALLTLVNWLEKFEIEMRLGGDIFNSEELLLLTEGNLYNEKEAIEKLVSYGAYDLRSPY